ncbi:hypothetical protein B0T16DRAFT_459077 [Cercophora newfieldiana]|uniref:Chitin-binding type-1 domain-containing protein n=1 Tax=Cercophora newfieldiana TaxID=92897 RepID=A0AA39XYZ1_9PEZI|nr:hypothetical protein B0T16DRAFT_459077 [Cercophora newfieldiana]
MRFTLALLATAACLVTANPAAPGSGTGSLLQERQGQCPCAPGLCCSQWGFCGTGPDYCGSQSARLPVPSATFISRISRRAPAKTAAPVA